MPRIGQGVQLLHSSDGTNFTAITDLTEIGEYGLGEGDDIDVTNHDSVGGFREFIRGLVDAGEITFTGQWNGTSDQQLAMSGANTGISTGPTTTLDWFRIISPDNLGTFNCRGYWKTFNLNPQLDDLYEFTGSIKVSGAPTLTVP